MKTVNFYDAFNIEWLQIRKLKNVTVQAVTEKTSIIVGRKQRNCTGVGYEGCSVAYPDGCPILQTESADPATRATEAKVHRTEDGKLRAAADPCHSDGE